MSSSTVERLIRNVEYACKANSRPIIWGPPGVGKSRSMDGLARRTGRRLVTVIGSYVDPTTMGFPVLDPDSRVQDLDGRNRRVVDTAPQRLFTDLNDDKRPWILFLDELTCVPLTVISTWLRLVDEGIAGDYRLDMRKGWIVAAANSADQAANGSPLPDPMVNRLAHFRFPVNEVSALEWANSFIDYWGAPDMGWPRDMRPAGVEDDHIIRARSLVSQFVRRVPLVWHPAIVPGGKEGEENKFNYGSGEAGWASARSLDRAGRTIAIALSEDRAPVTCLDIVEAEIGPAAAVEFQAFVATADVPDPEAVLAKPDEWRFSGRVDLDYAVMLSVAAAVASKPTPDRVLAGFTVCARSTADRAGAPAKEAAMAAVMKLGALVQEGHEVMKSIRKNRSPQEVIEFVQTVGRVAAPYAQYIKLIRG